MQGRLRAVGEFVRELRRRHVIRVALVYLAASWVILQVSTDIFPLLGIPDWTITFVLMLLIFGFPVTVILAWAFDLTSEGVQRTDTEPADAPSRPRRARAARRAAGDVTEDGDVAGARDSMAALPFVDRSPGSDQQFLGDGITDELINGLARVPGLRVVSRTSAFAFRGREADVREIGASLDVDWVLEGSIRATGDRLRLTVQLVDVEDGYALWSETYDRRIEDVFGVQEEVARSIVGTLSETLGLATPPAAGEPPLLQQSTDSVDAYALYLRGRAHWNERTPASLRTAMDYFERAIAEDAGYAHAYAGLADCYAILLDYGLIAPADGLPPARAAAERALQLRDDLAESHTSAALVRQLEWEWSAAEDAFRTALRLNPGHAAARHRLALLHAWQGRIQAGRDEIERARRLDPLSPVIAASRAWIEYYAGDYQAAIRLAKDTLADHRETLGARIPLALATVQVGQAEEAVSELERVLADAGPTGSTLSLLAYALARAGRTDAAERALQRLREHAGHQYTSSYYLAVAPLGLGREDEALAALERAAVERSPQLVYLKMEPLFAPLRVRPRFQAVLRTVGLP